MTTKDIAATTAIDGPLDRCLRTAREAMLRVGRAYLEWRMRRATVRLLMSLNEHTLRDLGLSGSQIHSAVHAEPDDRMRRYQIPWQ